MMCVASVTSESVTEARASSIAASVAAGARIGGRAAELGFTHRPSVRMRIWVDLTNSPHVLVMRPVIANLREPRSRGRGHGA